jgi:Asp-tRNA(Asn)/Glu-tRNA(Gln) amidotransferase A subunit family amidase
MADAGATIVRITIPGLDVLTRNIQVAEYETKIAFNKYLASLGPRAPVKTLNEFIAGGAFHSSLKAGLESDERVADGLNHPEYRNRLRRRDDLRQAIMSVIADNKLDAILYPHQRRLVARIGEEQLERNGVLSNSTGFPAITFPGGFSPPTSSAPLGVPVGIELLGPEWSEPRLIALAFAFEQAARSRRPPASTPPLDR